MRRFASALMVLTLLCASPVFADGTSSPCFQSNSHQLAVQMQQTLELNGITSTVRSDNQVYTVEVPSDEAGQARTIVEYVVAANQPEEGSDHWGNLHCGQL